LKYLVKSFRILFFVSILSFGQVQKVSTLHIGNTTNNSLSNSAVLQIDETARGFLPPRLTISQRDAISAPAAGLTIFNTTLNCLEWFDGSSWYSLSKNTSSGGTSIVSDYFCNIASSGSLMLNVPAVGVTQSISVLVNSPGSYNISAVSNGVVFSGSGVFTNTGLQNIVLTATGIPTADGNTTFTLNTIPSCSFTRKVNVYVNASVTIPNSIILSQSQKYLVASAYDEDYLPFTAPTTTASITSAIADGINESKIIDVQGTINSTTGINVKIPFTATGSGTLPAYSTTISIPASMTSDGIGRNLTLSWVSQPYTNIANATKVITANIVAIGGTLNLKKLDINSGLGSDYLGLLLGTFTYPYNNLGNTTTFEVRAVSLIPDRMAGVADITGNSNSHMMFYTPVAAEDGKIWLNNNLGADYSNMNKTSIFNPGKQATSLTDFNAYGSLFQWGRKPDGHELINWTSTNAGTPVNNTTSVTTIDEPITTSFITNSNTTPYDWRTIQNTSLWTASSSTNNPCPLNFRVPTTTEFNNYKLINGFDTALQAFDFSLKFVFAGNRYLTNGVLSEIGQNGGYFTSSISAANTLQSDYFAITTSGSIVDKSMRAYGRSIRCIKI
jgi:hypothetical protein